MDKIAGAFLIHLSKLFLSSTKISEFSDSALPLGNKFQIQMISGCDTILLR